MQWPRLTRIACPLSSIHYPTRRAFVIHLLPTRRDWAVTEVEYICCTNGDHSQLPVSTLQKSSNQDLLYLAKAFDIQHQAKLMMPVTGDRQFFSDILSPTKTSPATTTFAPKCQFVPFYLTTILSKATATKKLIHL